MENYRIFIALKLYPGREFCNDFAELKQMLPDEKIQWVPETNFHLTLAFLGDVPVREIKKLSRALDVISSGCRTFRLTTTGTGFFQKRGNPVVLWLGFQKNNMLETLARDVSAQMKKMGFIDSVKPFKAHLTLARVKFLKDADYFRVLAEEFSDDLFMSQQINEIILYRSILHTSGPEYQILSRHKLKN